MAQICRSYTPHCSGARGNSSAPLRVSPMDARFCHCAASNATPGRYQSGATRAPYLASAKPLGERYANRRAKIWPQAGSLLRGDWNCRERHYNGGYTIDKFWLTQGTQEPIFSPIRRCATLVFFKKRFEPIKSS